ncbi:GtrA family protein [Nakamurella alba]|uniref:GtrA family protein n=1 Tax=Nakamurella alba TaxID=2665158 RepID=UPI0018A9A754|nr:GtrA family protein [Nakamurella alba]
MTRLPLVRFAGIGTAATLVQLAVFAVLNPWVPGLPANVLSWTVATLAANATQRSLAFSVHGTAGLGRDLAVGLVSSVLGLLVSVLIFGILDTEDTVTGLLILIGVNTAIGLSRYFLLRRWFLARTG